MTEITPQEFIDGNYRARVWKDCLVWYHECVVEWVETYKRNAGRLYSLHNEDGSDSTLVQRDIPPYELLRVEDISNRPDLRNRLRALVDDIPDDDLNHAYVSMVKDIRWWKESEAYAAKKATG